MTTGYEEVKFLRKNHIFFITISKNCIFCSHIWKKNRKPICYSELFCLLYKIEREGQKLGPHTLKHLSKFKEHLSNQSDHSSSWNRHTIGWLFAVPLGTAFWLAITTGVDFWKLHVVYRVGLLWERSWFGNRLGRVVCSSSKHLLPLGGIVCLSLTHFTKSH